MTQAYGSQFVSQYGEEPLPAWVAALSQYSDEQIQLGYGRAIQDDREFVPNLSTLIGYIENNTDWEHSRQGRAAAEVLLDNPVDLGEGRYLEAPKDERTPAEHLAAMREGLY